MKLAILLIFILITITGISCIPMVSTKADSPDMDKPAYTSEQILEIARKFSPECRYKKPIDWTAKTAG